MACVDIAALPLQLLLRRNQRLHSHLHAVAVVDRNKPHGRILWVNERARECHILPGMTYTAALSLCRSLHADEVPAHDIERAIDSTVRQLWRFTPNVEPSHEDLGVFWLNASGFEPLYDSLLNWSHSIRLSIKQKEGFECTVVVGFTKFGTCAVAKGRRGITVFKEAADEEAAAGRVPLDRLALEPRVRDTLYKLGVKTVGDFADLPPEGIEKRFGKATRRWHRLARRDIRPPLEPRPYQELLCEQIHLEDPETDRTRLIVLMGRLLDRLRKVLTHRDEGIAELNIKLHFENGDCHVERIRPAAPTLDRVQIIDLIHLRLESVRFPDRVTGLVLTAQGHRANRKQTDFFTETPRRDLGAANRALARIKAKFGNGAVVHSRLGDGHLPEALFSWEPLEKIRQAHPRAVETGVLVRRIYGRAKPLGARPRHEPDGWMLRGLQQGPVVRVAGPYIISGGWWRKSIRREYYFAETQNGDLLWVYYDRFRRRWFMQGSVE